MLPERLLVGVKNAQYDNEIRAGDSKMDGEGEGIDGFNAHVIVSDGGGGGEMSDILKVPVEGICKFEAQPGRDAVIILEGFIDVINSIW